MHDPLMVFAQKTKDAKTELALWLKNDAQKYLLKNDLPLHLFRVAISHELPLLIPGVNLWEEIPVIDKLCTLKESGGLAVQARRRRARDKLARRIVKMRENGKSYKQIQADMGVSADRINRAIRAAKVRTEHRKTKSTHRAP